MDSPSRKKREDIWCSSHISTHLGTICVFPCVCHAEQSWQEHEIRESVVTEIKSVVTEN